jgi:hypothetical protein
MRNVSFFFGPETDVCAALSEGLGFFASLDVGRGEWAACLEDIGYGGLPVYLIDQESRKSWSADSTGDPGDEAWEDLVRIATPEEGFPYPQRAKVESRHLYGGERNGGIVTLITPGGVEVAINHDGNDQLSLVVNFHRESVFAATMMLARFAYREPEAYFHLAVAANELSQSVLKKDFVKVQLIDQESGKSWSDGPNGCVSIELNTKNPAAYIQMNGRTYYIDDSTNEAIMESWRTGDME